MKSERRHELQTNDLAEWLQTTFETIAPYRNAILGVVLLVIVGSLSFMIWRNYSQAQAADAWNALGVVVAQPNVLVPAEADRLDKVAATYAGSPAGDWAAISAADTGLLLGANQMLSDKKAGIQNIGIALDHYEKALNSVSSPLAKQRAMFGKARALESLGKLDDAIKAYQAMNEKYPQGMYKPVADQRIADLQRDDTRQFYDDLRTWEPKPPAPKTQTGSSPSLGLGNLGTLPDNPPDVPAVPQKPGGPDLGIPAPPTKPQEPGTGATTPAKPAEPKPAETKPADKKAPPPAPPAKAETPAAPAKTETPAKK